MNTKHLGYWTTSTYKMSYDVGNMCKRDIVKAMMEDHGLTREQAKETVKYW